MRESSRHPGRIGRTISVAGLHRVGYALHLVTKALKLPRVSSNNEPLPIHSGHSC
jgi:hypothetical protein